MEEEKKVTNPELIRLRGSVELREYALAAFYPLTHSGISAHHKRAVDRLPVIPAHPLTALCNIRSPTDLAAECRDAAARDALTPQGEGLRRLLREHGYQRSPDEPNEPKPWKKPWDK
jgi:hypothetical protein